MNTSFRKTTTAVLLATVVFLLAATALAQSPLGRLAGVVTDPTGAAIEGATITVTSDATTQTVTATSSSVGAFVVPQLLPGSYTVHVSAPGFATMTFSAVKVEPSREYSLTAALQVGATTETVDVVAGQDLVSTTSSEVSSTVTMDEVRSMPLNGRNPIDLVKSQAGVPGLINRTLTAINGGRPEWTQVTQDGISVQDNYIRSNAVDFLPNRPTTDSVAEFSIVTNNQGVESAGGATQVRMVTPSGSNTFHGSAFLFNRNSALAANEWFNKHVAGSPVEKPFLNRNQFGGRISGPVIKNRLFFYGFYEGLRQISRSEENVLVPRYDDYLTGNFRYVPQAGGATQTVNVLNLGAATPLTVDPVINQQVLSLIPAASVANNQDCTSNPNFGCYRFNQTDSDRINQWKVRLDYELNSAHHFEGIYERMTQNDRRTDIDAFNLDPLAFTTSGTHFGVAAWRWAVTPTLQNELRAGGFRAPVIFATEEQFGDFLYGTDASDNLYGLALRSPVVPFQPQGRDTRTYQIMDNATWVKGNHAFQMGGSIQLIKVRSFDNFGSIPTLYTGFSLAALQNDPSLALDETDFAAAPSGTDLDAANALRAFLAGQITEIDQTFQVQSKTSGFVPGMPNVRNFQYNDYNVYFQDSWRLFPNFTLRAGLKWEYFTPMKEADDLMLAPVLNGRSVQEAVLDPNGRVDFVNGHWYNKDLNNFGPSVGFAWDPFKDGKTSLRGGYTLAFINDAAVTSTRNAMIGNDGLSQDVYLTNLDASVAAGVPAVPVPQFSVPRTYLQQLDPINWGFSTNPYAAAYGIDQNLRNPYVQQFSLGVQRELWWQTAVEARYIGTMGKKLWRAIDYNQQRAYLPEFLADFARARSNAFLSQAAGLGFNPYFNPNVAGSQPLPFMDQIEYGGYLAEDLASITAIRQNEPGRLTDMWVGTYRDYFPTAVGLFLPNPNIYVADALTNAGDTNYHALQTEFRRRMSNGLAFTFNYTWSRAMSNAEASSGLEQSRFEPFLDIRNPRLEYTRAAFDVRHVAKGNFIYELPFGKGKRWLSDNPVVDRLVGGWRLASLIYWQSGSPFKILSNRGTLNRPGRSSGRNTALTNLSNEQIQALLGITAAPGANIYSSNLYYFDPSVFSVCPPGATSCNGRAVGPDRIDNSGSTSFDQVFFNPVAGTVGNIGRLEFDGPSQYNWDFSIAKVTRIKEGVSTEVRADFFNFTNSPSFWVGDQNINSSSFGMISYTNSSARVVQLSARVEF